MLYVSICHRWLEILLHEEKLLSSYSMSWPSKEICKILKKYAQNRPKWVPKWVKLGTFGPKSVRKSDCFPEKAIGNANLVLFPKIKVWLEILLRWTVIVVISSTL